MDIKFRLLLVWISEYKAESKIRDIEDKDKKRKRSHNDIFEKLNKRIQDYYKQLIK